MVQFLLQTARFYHLDSNKPPVKENKRESYMYMYLTRVIILEYIFILVKFVISSQMHDAGKTELTLHCVVIYICLIGLDGQF